MQVKYYGNYRVRDDPSRTASYMHRLHPSMPFPTNRLQHGPHRRRRIRIHVGRASRLLFESALDAPIKVARRRSPRGHHHVTVRRRPGVRWPQLRAVAQQPPRRLLQATVNVRGQIGMHAPQLDLRQRLPFDVGPTRRVRHVVQHLGVVCDQAASGEFARGVRVRRRNSIRDGGGSAIRRERLTNRGPVTPTSCRRQWAGRGSRDAPRSPPRRQEIRRCRGERARPPSESMSTAWERQGGGRRPLRRRQLALLRGAPPLHSRHPHARQPATRARPSGTLCQGRCGARSPFAARGARVAEAVRRRREGRAERAGSAAAAGQASGVCNGSSPWRRALHSPRPRPRPRPRRPRPRRSMRRSRLPSRLA
eukprot:scaffold36081_cov63-Phaeocystis_antarctica.AAC.2